MRFNIFLYRLFYFQKMVLDFLCCTYIFCLQPWLCSLCFLACLLSLPVSMFLSGYTCTATLWAIFNSGDFHFTIIIPLTIFFGRLNFLLNLTHNFWLEFLCMGLDSILFRVFLPCSKTNHKSSSLSSDFSNDILAIMTVTSAFIPLLMLHIWNPKSYWIVH